MTNLSAIMTRPKPQTSEATLRNDEKLLAAMDCYRINTKVSIRALAKRFGVARTTLQDQIHGAISRAEEMNSRHRLSPTETRVLAEHAIAMQKLHFPLTPQDIRNEAQCLWHSKNKLAEAQGEMIGVNWYNEVFLRDNPEMANKMGKGLDQDWATCASHAQLAAWYDDVYN